MNTNFILLLTLTFLLNLPFGYWRGGEKKFSWQWFVAIHVPVVFLYFMRNWMGIERNWITLPILLVAFFSGQLVGRKFREKRENKKASSANR